MGDSATGQELTSGLSAEDGTVRQSAGNPSFDQSESGAETAKTALAGSAKPTLDPRPRASLSPSRAADFMTCPLLYRLRSIDKLPQQPSEAASRGTLVHSILEELFDEPANNRTPEVAIAAIPEAWQTMSTRDPSLAALLFGPDDNWERHLADQPLLEPDTDKINSFLKATGKLLQTYFRLEDPRALEPEQREAAVSVTLDSGLTLRGIIDRIDKAPTGEIRVVDYKTGRSPGAGWETKALFQMRFYGLVLWRMTGQIPSRLQLIYLGNQEILAEDPTERQLLTTQAKLEALWQAIEQARTTGNWQPRATKLCGWCSFKSVCPEWGGTPPPLREQDSPEQDSKG